MRVLVVENNPDIRELVQEMAEAVGCAAEAVSGTEAAAQLASGAWDVLLTDLLLADGTTGLDLAEQAAACGVRTVIMSGALDRKPVVTARGLRFLAKPFLLAQLCAALELPAAGQETA